MLQEVKYTTHAGRDPQDVDTKETVGLTVELVVGEDEARQRTQVSKLCRDRSWNVLRGACGERARENKQVVRMLVEPMQPVHPEHFVGD